MDMYNYLSELKRKQNKQEVLNRRQAKKRVELPDRHVDVETPTKLKRIEVEIEVKEDDKENSIGKLRELRLFGRFPSYINGLVPCSLPARTKGWMSRVIVVVRRSRRRQRARLSPKVPKRVNFSFLEPEAQAHNLEITFFLTIFCCVSCAPRT